MSSWLLEFVKDPDKRAALSWLGGGIVAVASGIWSVVKFFADRKKADGGGDTNTSVVSGQITSVHDPATISKLTPLQKAAAIAGIVGAVVAVPAGLIQLLRPTLPTLQQIEVGNVQATGQGNTVIANNTAPVSVGPSKEQIEQIQTPQAEQLEKKDAQIAALNAQNAALTNMLLEKNPAAGPAAQQAVGAAVGSIAQGAAEGDARLQHALDLLKENKIADASRLLNAVAEDKTAHAEQETARAAKDRKDAAIAYRNLGAIAGLADPKRALEAFEKAVALDPDDLESLVWAGWIEIEYGDLNKAQARLQRVLTLAETGNQTSDKYWALAGLGDIKQRRGDLTGALKSYNDSLAIAEGLAKSGTGNAGWQYYLGSNERIGDVQMAQGELASALKSYEAKRDIISRLAKSGPGNAGWQRDLSVALIKIGDVQMAQGDLAGALKSYPESLAIRERLATFGPGNAGW